MSLTSIPSTDRASLEKISIIALLAAVWLLSHPYRGIWHDASLYVAQALQRLDPAAFKHDIFFQYGSQDQFTVFTPLYGWLIKAVGLNAASITLLLTLQTTWLVAYWALCRRFLEGQWLYLGLFLAIGMSPRYYGGFEIFSYAENFLTARIAAEAIGLAAMAIYFSERRNLGLALALVATAIHPLIGGWVAMLLFALRLNWRISALCVGLGAIALVIFKPHLFATLLMPMDPEWRRLVSENCMSVFPELWWAEHWGRAAMTFGLLLTAAAATKDRTRIFWSTLAGIVFLAMGLCWIGTATFHSVLLTQLQLWRALWLAAALQWIAAAQLAQILWPDKNGRLWLYWLLIAWMLQSNWGGALAVAISLAFWGTHQKKLPSPSPFLSKWLTIATFVALVISFAMWLPNAVMDASLEGGNYIRNDSLISQILNGTALSQAALLPLLALWWLISCEPSRRRSTALGALAVGLLIAGIINWDQRHDLRRFLEVTASRAENRPFATLIKSGDTVYWPGNLDFAWSGLRTAHYASSKQVSGIVFNRDTALEIERRLYRTSEMALPLDKMKGANRHQLEAEISKLGMGDDLRSKETIKATPSGLVHLCHDPVLDFVILGTPLSGLFSATCKTPVGKVQFWLYDCRNLRKRYPDPLPAVK